MIDPTLVKEARKLHKTGLSYAAVGRELGVSADRARYAIKSRRCPECQRNFVGPNTTIACMSCLKIGPVGAAVRELNMPRRQAERELMTFDYKQCPKCGGPCKAEAEQCRECYKKDMERHSEHGSPGRYARGCRCDVCKDAHNARHREYIARARAGGTCRNCSTPITITSKSGLCHPCSKRRHGDRTSRQALELRATGMTYRQIGAVLGITADGVKQAMQRARERGISLSTPLVS